MDDQKNKTTKRGWNPRKSTKIVLRQRQYQHEYVMQTRFGGLRDRILERDNYQCQHPTAPGEICGITDAEHMKVFGTHIQIDHKDEVGRGNKNPNNIEDNLRTLCVVHHSQKTKALQLVKRGYDLSEAKFRKLDRGQILSSY